MSPLSVEKLNMLLKALAPKRGEGWVRGIKIRLSIPYSLYLYIYLKRKENLKKKII